MTTTRIPPSTAKTSTFSQPGRAEPRRDQLGGNESCVVDQFDEIQRDQPTSDEGMGLTGDSVILASRPDGVIALHRTSAPLPNDR